MKRPRARVEFDVGEVDDALVREALLVRQFHPDQRLRLLEGGAFSVIPEQPFALRAVLERRGSRPHGHVEGLAPQDVDDLLAYLMSI